MTTNLSPDFQNYDFTSRAYQYDIFRNLLIDVSMKELEQLCALHSQDLNFENGNFPAEIIDLPLIRGYVKEINKVLSFYHSEFEIHAEDFVERCNSSKEYSPSIDHDGNYMMTGLLDHLLRSHGFSLTRTLRYWAKNFMVKVQNTRYRNPIPLQACLIVGILDHDIIFVVVPMNIESDSLNKVGIRNLTPVFPYFEKKRGLESGYSLIF